MPTPTKGARLGGGPQHERILLANLAQSLFEHGRVTTTVAKARRLRPYAERLVTFAKRGDLASRRRVLGVIRDKSVVHVLFTQIAPTFADRKGGYTRIVKIGNRKGDNAPLAIIELVDGAESLKQGVISEATRTTSKAASGEAVEKAPKAPKAPKAEKPAKPVTKPTGGAVAKAKAAPKASAGKAAPVKKSTSASAKMGAK